MSAALWEPDHDYYGPEGSFWVSPIKEAPYIQRFDSWQEFIDDAGMSDAPMGMNFLYRWDWHDWKSSEFWDESDGSPPMEVELFWMMPRKGIMARSTITVTPDDEDAVRAWLEPHWTYMRDLWAPLSDARVPA